MSAAQTLDLSVPLPPGETLLADIGPAPLRRRFRVPYLAGQVVYLPAQRAAELAPPIQMCDALSRNLPGELQTIVANCLAHGRRQFDERLVEPNSSLGGASAYMLKHWEKLTLFLRVPGAPLDNTRCERALKKAILHRKNALFYKTENDAHVGDLYMSLVYSCELCGVNWFDYLTELERHADELAMDLSLELMAKGSYQVEIDTSILQLIQLL